MKLDRIVLQGHTDAWGERNYNEDLSLNRANAVRDYLYNEGFEDVSIVVEAYGSLRPICSIENPECQPKNRRVDISVIYE